MQQNKREWCNLYFDTALLQFQTDLQSNGKSEIDIGRIDDMLANLRNNQVSEVMLALTERAREAKEKEKEKEKEAEMYALHLYKTRTNYLLVIQQQVCMNIAECS